MMNIHVTLRAALVTAATIAAATTATPALAQAGAEPPAADQACIAVVLPSASGVDGDATAFATALRELFNSYLTGPSVRTVSLEARLSSHAIEEARLKGCSHVLLTSIAMKRNDGSGWGKALGRAAGTAAWHGAPYVGGATGAAARGAAIAGAEAISTMAHSTRAKDEATLEYRIGTADSVMRAPVKTSKLKAKRDGEDVLTPLVEKASESIVAVVTRK
jgi:hypothetical protein